MVRVELPVSDAVSYAISGRTLRRWATERLRRERRADGGVIYSFMLSGSTCSNMGVPLEVVMTVALDGDGRIRAASSRPASRDSGCDAMCAAQGDGRSFLEHVGGCPEVIGLTLAEAASHDWQEEASGCFCTATNRRHKWRNVFQTLHYSATHPL